MDAPTASQPGPARRAPWCRAPSRIAPVPKPDAPQRRRVRPRHDAAVVVAEIRRLRGMGWPGDGAGGGGPTDGA